VFCERVTYNKFELVREGNRHQSSNTYATNYEKCSNMFEENVENEPRKIMLAVLPGLIMLNLHAPAIER